MTANLLAHCDLFRAGIARSGAYNRTLTPFGFQSERRTLWEAPEIYLKMSPFMYADKTQGADSADPRRGGQQLRARFRFSPNACTRRFAATAATYGW